MRDNVLIIVHSYVPKYNISSSRPQCSKKQTSNSTIINFISSHHQAKLVMAMASTVYSPFLSGSSVEIAPGYVLEREGVVSYYVRCLKPPLAMLFGQDGAMCRILCLAVEM